MSITYQKISVQLAPELTIEASQPFCDICNLPAGRYFIAWRDAEEWARRHTSELHTMVMADLAKIPPVPGSFADKTRTAEVEAEAQRLEDEQ